MTTTHNLGGRPKGLIRRTHISNGAYSENQGDVLAFWQRHNQATADHCEEIINKYLRRLEWTEEHPRFSEVRDLAVLTISRRMLFMKILEEDYERRVKNPDTGTVIRMRACDQLTRLEEIDADIQARLVKLGLISIVE